MLKESETSSLYLLTRELFLCEQQKLSYFQKSDFFVFFALIASCKTNKNLAVSLYNNILSYAKINYGMQ